MENRLFPAVTTSLAAAAPLRLGRQYALLASFLITLLYLLAEVAYNVGLVRLLSSPGLSKDTIQGMETVGKAMASLGITLFISRLLPLRRWWLYPLLIVTLYSGLGVAMDRVIDQLPDQAKRAGHWLGMYRVAALEGQVADQDLNPAGGTLSSGQRMAMVNLALLMYADQGAVEHEARQYLAAKVTNHIDYIALDNDFARFWQAYSAASSQLEPAWNWYRHKTEAQQRQSATLKEFMAALEQNPQFGGQLKNYNKTVLYKGNPALALPPVIARDIPLFLNRDQLRQYFHLLIESNTLKAVDHFAPDTGPKASQTSQLTRDLSVSVFIPPISMSLSLFSTFLNVASLLGLLVAYGLGETRGQWAAPGRLKTAQCATVLLVLGALATCNMPPFAPHSKFAASSEKALQQNVLQRLWVAAINHEALLLETAGSLPLVTAAADRLPKLGQTLRL